ncbi:MAG: NAD-dependent malic enzyme [Acidobacteriota bacterium]
MKNFAIKVDALTGEEYYEVRIRGSQLINNAFLNKASAFSPEERKCLALEGHLRSAVQTLDQQAQRVMENYARKPSDIERYIFLQGLLDRNETLFYKVVVDHLQEMVPIVYTPTVGQACLMASHIQRRYRGMYITPENIGSIDAILQSVSRPEIYLIVVTDGERILGLGDLGSDGMPIPVGKISLYVAAGGLHPAGCLPVCLDVGTNNERLLKDPLYLGYQKPRLTGQAYEDFVERFVLGVRRNFPNALLQWEDFAKDKAFVLLDRYRERLLSFNDDIQGTGAVSLAALMTAMRIKKERMEDQRFLIVGMGQAGTGTARRIRDVLRERGLSDEEVRRRIFAVDVDGLLLEDTPNLEEPQVPFAQRRSAVEGWTLDSPSRIGLMDVIRNARPTVIVGVTAKRGLFSGEVLRAMASFSERPVVLSLSNPTAKSECTPEEVAQATGGRGLMATGSPFDPFSFEGRTFESSQCNNLYVFPGVGLGALVAQSTRVTQAMFLAASRSISGMVSPAQEARGLLLPEMKDIREVAFRVALSVAQVASEAGLGRRLDEEALARLIRKAQWTPQYYPYRAG